jgi:hypothetical protein
MTAVALLLYNVSKKKVLTGVIKKLPDSAIMNDHADGGNDDVFIYMGGNQRAPRNVTHIRIHKSVKIISAWAFNGCRNLVSIEMHDGVEIIETQAFCGCTSLIEIKLPGVRVIREWAFHNCTALESVEFGDKLDAVGFNSFSWTALRSIKIPKVRTIGNLAFQHCDQLTEVKLSKHLERIGQRVFSNCPRLRCIAIPLKGNLLDDHVFYGCDNLSTVDLVGGVHKTFSSLLLDNWRNEMNDEIERINQLLPNTQYRKTAVIQRWMGVVLERITHYKSEHYALLKEFTTLLELALWKAKLDEEFGFEEALSKEVSESNKAKKAKIDVKTARHEARITSGANIVINNVLPFIKLE